jgi:chromosome segregation ATPase
MHLDAETLAKFGGIVVSFRFGEYLLARLRNSGAIRHEKADRIGVLEAKVEALQEQVGRLQAQLAEERVAHSEQTARFRIDVARLERELADVTAERDELLRKGEADAAKIAKLEALLAGLRDELNDLCKQALAQHAG